jgi:hypothetical protein
MQGAGDGPADQHRADRVEVSDDVGRVGRDRREANIFVSVYHSLDGTNIGAKGCKALAAALQTNTALTKLK